MRESSKKENINDLQTVIYLMLMTFLVMQMFRKWRMIYSFGTGIYNLQF